MLVWVSKLDWLREVRELADNTWFLLKEEALSHLYRAVWGHKGMPASWLSLLPPPKPTDGSAVSLLIGQEWPNRSASGQEELPTAFSSSQHEWQWGVPPDLSSFLLWTKRWRDMTIRKSSLHEHVSMHSSLSDTTTGKDCIKLVNWVLVPGHQWIHSLSEDNHWENLFGQNIWIFPPIWSFSI